MNAGLFSFDRLNNLLMKKTRISLGADHAGFVLKKEIKTLLEKLGCDVLDRGAHNGDRVDYPDYAAVVAKDVQDGNANYGIICCGTGIGMAITANKFRGIRAASIVDEYSLLMARKHNDLNVLCLGSRVIGGGTAMLLVETFLKTDFEGERHQERLDKITELENLLCVKY